MKTAPPTVKIPHAPEAELAVTRALVTLGRPDVIEAALSIVSPADFHDPACRAVFGATVDIRKRGLVVNKISVCELLRERGKLEFVGGAEAVGFNAYANLIGDTASVTEWALTIANAASRRKLVQMAHRINDGIASNADTSEIVDAARSALDRLPTGRAELDIQSLDAVAPEAVEWMWRNRIAYGKLTLFCGDPGSGKSFASLATAAAVTTGAPLPGDNEKRDPAEVLLATYEDGVADTVRPRADALGVDVSRVHIIQGRAIGADTKPFSLTDIPVLVDELHRRPGVRLLIVDPISAMLGGIDTHRDADLRSALAPLAQLAEKTRVAVVLIAHLSKQIAARALYRVGGSIAYTGVSRSVLLFAEDASSGRRAVASLKNSLGALPPTIEYRIDDSGFRWLGVASELNADRLLAPAPTDEERADRTVAEEIILEALADGRRRVSEILEIAERRGVKQRTLYRAADKLGVRKEREGFGSRGVSYWSLLMSANTHSSANKASMTNMASIVPEDKTVLAISAIDDISANRECVARKAATMPGSRELRAPA